jgi:hypothetical protein
MLYSLDQLSLLEHQLLVIHETDFTPTHPLTLLLVREKMALQIQKSTKYMVDYFVTLENICR